MPSSTSTSLLAQNSSYQAALLGEVVLDVVAGGPVEGAVAPVGQLAHRQAAGGVVGHDFSSRIVLPSVRVDPEDHLGEVLSSPQDDVSY